MFVSNSITFHLSISLMPCLACEKANWIILYLDIDKVQCVCNFIDSVAQLYCNIETFCKLLACAANIFCLYMLFLSANMNTYKVTNLTLIEIYWRLKLLSFWVSHIPALEVLLYILHFTLLKKFARIKKPSSPCFKT